MNKIIVKQSEREEFFNGLEFDSDGGNIAIVNGCCMLRIDLVRKWSDLPEAYVIEEFNSNSRDSFTGIEDASLQKWDWVMTTVYESKEEALKAWSDQIRELTDNYLSSF